MIITTVKNYKQTDSNQEFDKANKCYQKVDKPIRFPFSSELLTLSTPFILILFYLFYKVLN